MPTESVIYFDEHDVAVELVAHRYDVEVELEDRLAKWSTQLIPGEQIKPEDPRRWLLVRQQFPLRGRAGNDWSADILLLDQDGVPTIIEVKRADNRELRREVVGQVLDYAAALRYGGPDRIREEYEDRTSAGEGPLSGLLEFLDGGDVETF